MPRSPSYAAAVAGLLLAVTACSAGPEPAPEVEAPSGDASSEAPFTAPELEGGGNGGGSAAPSFRGRLPATISPAERDVIDDPCTGNQIERLCGSSARFELRPTGRGRPVELVRATTSTDPGGLTWRVRLAFDPADAPLPRSEGDGVLLLETARGLQVEVGRDAVVTGAGVVLPGLTKRAAWGLVTRLGDA